MKYLLIRKKTYLSIIGLIFIINFANIKSSIALNIDTLPTLSSQDSGDTSLPDCRRQLISDKNELSLLSAVCIAVQRYPTISSAIASYAGQVDMVDAARAGYLPQVSFGAQTTKGSGNKEGYQSTPKLTMQQRLYDFGKVSSAIDQAEGSATRQQALLLEAIDNIIYQSGNAVIEVERLEELEQKTNAMIVGIKRVVEIAKSRANAGISTQSDYIQSQSRLEAAESSLLTVRMQLDAARIRLATYLGREYKNVQLAPMSNKIFNNTVFKFKLDTDQIPSIMLSKADQSIAKAQLKAAEASLYPTISAVGSVEKTIHGNNPNTGKTRGNYNYIGLSIEQSIYSGGENTAKIKSAQRMLNASKYDLEAVMLNLNDRAQSLKVNILGIESRLNIIDQHIASISKTRVLYQEQYTLGSRPILDLLNAEQEIFQAESEKVNALNDMWSYYIQYIVVTGNARRLFNLNAIIQPVLGN
ncbi:TolC family protein [Orbus wheelerorum]|uniref:TolC family protein n=1 Tax=Orbus wheelerorum TaxID=3074111 RepID=UPI00370D8E46